MCERSCARTTHACVCARTDGNVQPDSMVRVALLGEYGAVTSTLVRPCTIIHSELRGTLARWAGRGACRLCARAAGRHCGCTLPVVRRMLRAQRCILSVVVRAVQYSEYPTAPQYATVATALRLGHCGARLSVPAWDWLRRFDCARAVRQSMLHAWESVARGTPRCALHDTRRVCVARCADRAAEPRARVRCVARTRSRATA